MENNYFRKILITATYLILFACFFITFLHPNLRDYDFWWHIATGRYIAENHSLPSLDPFSYTAEIKEDFTLAPQRESFILKQYWLSQVLFYYLYKLWGPASIIILRALLLTLFLFALFQALKKEGIRTILIYLILFASFKESVASTGERPQLFSFVSSVIVFILIEKLKSGSKSRSVFLLPLLMALWSNLHGGFVVGDAIILVYLVSESVVFFSKKSSLKPAQYYLFLFVSLSSIAFSFLNPNTYRVFTEMRHLKHFTEGIEEFESPFFYYRNKIYAASYFYISFLCVGALTVILRFRQIGLARLLVLSGLISASMISARYVIFTCIGMVIAGKELNNFIDFLENKLAVMTSSRKKYADSLTLLTALVLSIFFLSSSIPILRNSGFKIDTLTYAPANAVKFIKDAHIKGRMFNEYNIGGYLIWELYPERKVFIDTRGLRLSVLKEYSAIQDGVTIPVGHLPLWDKLLELYRVNFIITPPLDYHGGLYGLIPLLTESSRWELIFNDHYCLVFIKNIPENAELINKFKISKEKVYDTIIVQATYKSAIYKRNPLPLKTLGDAFFKLKRYEDAKKAYGFALDRDPSNKEFRDKLEYLEHNIQYQPGGP